MKLNCLRYAAIAAALLVALISCSGRAAVAPEQVNSPPVQMEFSASRDAASGFDPDGKEIVSSSDYIGFTMDAGLGENSEDFRRLLLADCYSCGL